MSMTRGVALGLLLAAGAAAPPWELVAGVGALRIVYVDPARIRDTKLLADIVVDLYTRFGKEHAFQIDFFDDRTAAPQELPYSAEQRRHHKAKFNFNPKNGMQRFVWLDLVPDPNDATRLRIKETEEKLPLP